MKVTSKPKKDPNKDGMIPMQEVNIGPKIKQTTFVVHTPL